MSERPPAAVWIATCGGLGFFPVAPGTVGSVVGVALVVALAQLPLATPNLIASVVACALMIGALGVWTAGLAETHFGRTDPQSVIIDEVVGQMLTLAAWPRASWEWLLAGFLLFRALDVLKPFPARRAERLPAGWGIMMDDVISGLYSLGLLAVAHFVLK